MFLKIFKTQYKLFIFLIIFALIFAIRGVVLAINEPGSDADPIVTQSYVDNKVNELASKINQSSNNTSTNITVPKFEVIELTLGQKLIAEGGTEIVLRGGTANAIASSSGGLADLTAASIIDIMTGENVPVNHLLLVSKSDGRGIKATSKKVWILVKGGYKLS